MQAITTKYLGPTDHTGSRIVARCQAKRITVAWDHALDVEGNHRVAAQILVSRLAREHGLSWSGNWIGGALPDGHGYCYVRVGVQSWDHEGSFTVGASVALDAAARRS